MADDNKPVGNKSDSDTFFPATRGDVLGEPSTKSQFKERMRKSKEFLSRLYNPLTVIGIIIVVTLILMAFFAPIIATHDPIAIDLTSKNLPPSFEHFLGTDGFGRDIYSRIVYGAQISLFVGIVSVLGAVAIGVPLGIVSAYVGGKLDSIVMRIMDILLAFPSIVLAIAIAIVIGYGIMAVTVAILVVSIPVYARIGRGADLSVSKETYIEAARAIGASSPRIIFRHIFPNTLAPILVQMTLDIGTAVLALAGLSFLGLGPPYPYTYDWGRMIADSFTYQAVTKYWWQITFPGLAIIFCVLGWNLFGDGLRDAMDPKLRLKLTKEAKKHMKELEKKKKELRKEKNLSVEPKTS
ncbi:MAG: ABC transporter permease [Candidatus Odinarchaeia archaeon]